MTQVKNQNNNRIGNRMNVKYTGSQPHRHLLFSNKPKKTIDAKDEQQAAEEECGSPDLAAKLPQHHVRHTTPTL